RVDLESQEVCKRRVQEAERVRKTHLLTHLDLIAATVSPRRRCPLPNPVQRDDGRALERRREEGAGRVRFVVTAPTDLLLPSEALPQRVRDPSLARDPLRNGSLKWLESARRFIERGLEEALELQKRGVIKADDVDVLGRLEPGLS